MGRARTRLLRKAQQLLQMRGSRSRTASGVCRTARSSPSNSCWNEPSFQPHHATFIKNLGQLGIEASIRLIDACSSARAWRI